MGAAGDMLCAALADLYTDKEKPVRMLNSIGIPGVEFKLEKSVKCGITGSHMKVTVNGEEEGPETFEHHHDHEHDHEHEHEHSHHHHSGLRDIEHIVRDHLDLPEKVKDDVMAVYRIIAEAEGHVHGKEIDEIHFHEVGTMDAVADIAAFCLLVNDLKPDRIIASPICTGSGQVRCAHGILPVPAPATAYILQGIPVYSGNIKSELCTPTGAALLRHFAAEFGPMPTMTFNKIGYGMGKKDFEAANCLRAYIGENPYKSDMIVELSCNVDDMTAEEIGFATEEIFKSGAIEVYTAPVYMKKNRPGTLITVLCRPDDKENVLHAVFRYTSTIGIRQTVMDRYVLDRKTIEVETPLGKIRKKVSEGYGVKREKYEYDDVTRIAGKNRLSIKEVISLADAEDK